jgi:hypothetical protein
MASNLLSYIHFLNIPIALYVYPTVQTETVAIVALSASIFHQNVYKPSSNILITCIHLRSFAALCTNYYYSRYHACCWAISCPLHLFFWRKTKKGLDYMTIPLAVDTTLFIMNSENVTALLLVTLALITVLLYNPFDEMNDVALHVLLLVQTYFACISSKRNAILFSQNF